MTKKRYEIIDKNTGHTVGIYTKLGINAIKFNEDNYIIKEYKVESEADRVKAQGRY